MHDRLVAGPDGDIPVRVYRPVTQPDGVLAVTVFAHGGGWVLCDLDSHDGICRAVCNAAGCVVVAVDYRLAPEHRFPAGLDDVSAVLRWIADHGDTIDVDPHRLAVMGDSAGGNLAAAAALVARDRGGPDLRAQVLVYPVIDYRFDTSSHVDPGHEHVLQSDEVQYFWQEYLADPADAEHPYASPLRSPSLAGLPPALVITAGYDPLRDEGRAYAAALAAAGVTTEAVHYPSLMHSFLSFRDELPDARDAIDRIGAALARALVDP